MKKILFLVMLASIILASCTSRGGKRVQEERKNIFLEKVVIIDSSIKGQMYMNEFHYKYKVNRYTQGVVGYALEEDLYEVGDTILVPINKLR